MLSHQLVKINHNDSWRCHQLLLSYFYPIINIYLLHIGQKLTLDLNTKAHATKKRVYIHKLRNHKKCNMWINLKII